MQRLQIRDGVIPEQPLLVQLFLHPQVFAEGDAEAPDPAATLQLQQAGLVRGAEVAPLIEHVVAGQQALARLQAGMAEGGEFSQRFDGGVGNFLNDAGLQFRIQQGTKALQNTATARGLRGGNTAKAITDYAQGAASDEYDRAFNRNLTSFTTNRKALMDPLQALIGAGMDADRSRLGGATNQAQLGLQGTMGAGNQLLDAERSANTFRFGGAQGSADMAFRGAQLANGYRTDAASAIASGHIGRGNAINGALGGVAQGASQIDWNRLFRRTG